MIPSLALHKLQQEQKHHCADECADEFAELAGGAEPEEAEEKPAQQCADHAYNDVAHDAEAVTFDDESRQKTGGQSDESEPNPVFHMLANVASTPGKATLTLENLFCPPSPLSLAIPTHPGLRVSEA